MTEKSKARSGKRSPNNVEDLAIGKETVQELTEDEAQSVQGGNVIGFKFTKDLAVQYKTDGCPLAPHGPKRKTKV
jgi:hypothetical protein